MSVFDKNVKVPRAVHDPKTDKNLPPSGALSWGGIKTSVGLAATTGVDATLIHGDRDRQINGNESSRITMDRHHKVGANQTNLVGADRTDNTAGSHRKTVIGSSQRMHIGPTADTYVDTHCCEHKADQQVQEPVSYMHVINEKFSKYLGKVDEHQQYTFIADVFSSFVTVLYTDYRSTYAMLTPVASASATGVNLHAEGFDNATRGFESKIDGIKASIEAIQPEVSITMLHEVAITQKIIIVGVNQWI
jgi:hypothetical protein